MGLFMQRNSVIPDKIVCSSAVRAKETLDLVKSAAGFTCAVDIEADLYGASADAILRVVRRQSSQYKSLLFVGHNPGFEDLVLGLSGSEVNSGDLLAVRKKFPTAAFASIEFEVSQLSEIGLKAGKLVRYVRPKDKTIV
jgi:phosphohistidine phosphatase